MHTRFISKSFLMFIATSLFSSSRLLAQADTVTKQPSSFHGGNMIMLIMLLVIVLGAAIFLKIKTSEVVAAGRKKKKEIDKDRLDQYVSNMDSKQIDEFLRYKEDQRKEGNTGENFNSKLLAVVVIVITSLFSQTFVCTIRCKKSRVSFGRKRCHHHHSINSYAYTGGHCVNDHQSKKCFKAV